MKTILRILLALGILLGWPGQASAAQPSDQPKISRPAAENIPALGWAGQVQCKNCAPFKAHIEVHHYDPQQGKINCFTWSEEFQYCMSPTASLIPWESVWGIAAACPMEWPIGTWLDIPEVGRFICFDRGDLIFCEPDQSRCFVDLLGPGGEAWDGKIFDITLWVPLKPRK